MLCETRSKVLLPVLKTAYVGCPSETLVPVDRSLLVKGCNNHNRTDKSQMGIIGHCRSLHRLRAHNISCRNPRCKAPHLAGIPGMGVGSQQHAVDERTDY